MAWLQSWLRESAGKQHPLCMCLGKLLNSQALTRSLWNTNQIPLFYLESGERICNIKAKTSPWSHAFLTCRSSSLHRPVSSLRNGQQQLPLWYWDDWTCQNTQVLLGTRQRENLLTVTGRRNLMGLSEWCAASGDPRLQRIPVPPAFSHSGHMGMGNSQIMHSFHVLSLMVWAAVTAPRLVLRTVTCFMTKAAVWSFSFTYLNMAKIIRNHNLAFNLWGD